MFGILLGHDHRHGTGLANAVEHVEHFLLAFGVEGRGGFVKNKHIGFRRERGRDGHALHLASRQAGRYTLAVSGHADQVEHDVDLLVDDVWSYSAVFQRESDLILDTRAEQLRFRILLHVADALRQCRDGVPARIHAINFHDTTHGAVGQVRNDAGQCHA